ncbi:PHD finger protein 14 [Acanthosepion pharaonis]|uniref:PHD finger protein 14 n=1 Tax=Acanthosepion pharaonis TaxID=158019 RepID=A0A812CZX7_ACAPH|nr:PHD finger protein 14 [Sepia pharaonis]
MPYARWGAKECSLCEDSRFSRTGVCISCDAVFFPLFSFLIPLLFFLCLFCCFLLANLQPLSPFYVLGIRPLLTGFSSSFLLRGISIQNVSQDKQETRKKWHMSPALSLEFISYYLDRNARMDTMKINMKELSSQNDKLQEQQKVLRVQYDQLLNEMNRLKDSTSKLQQNGEETWGILTDLSGQELNIPEMFRVRKSPRSPTKRETHPKSPPAPAIQHCGICKKSTDQHLLAKCDSCSKHYHLGCLDPPLSRMPKKTKLQGWQCSECASSSSDVSEETGVDVDAPRKLREKIKEPIKFEQLQSLDIKSEKRLRNRSNTKQKKGKKRKSVKADKGGKREDHEDSEGVMEL